MLPKPGDLGKAERFALWILHYPVVLGAVLWEILIWGPPGAHTPAGLGEPMMVISIFGGKISVENKTMCMGMFGRLMAPSSLSKSSCPSAALVTPHSSEDIICR